MIRIVPALVTVLIALGLLVPFLLSEIKHRRIMRKLDEAEACSKRAQELFDRGDHEGGRRLLADARQLVEEARMMRGER